MKGAEAPSTQSELVNTQGPLQEDEDLFEAASGTTNGSDVLKEKDAQAQISVSSSDFGGSEAADVVENPSTPRRFTEGRRTQLLGQALATQRLRQDSVGSRADALSFSIQH